MSNTSKLVARNSHYANNFTDDNLPVVPKMRTVIITCGDARVDPTQIFSLALGDSVVIRNNGGRVTSAVIEELAAMAFMVAKMDGETPGPFEVILMQHTQCGAERFADPGFQKVLLNHVGVDVSRTAISDHEKSLREDIDQLRNSPVLPGYIIVSGFIYDIKTGRVNEVITPAALK